MWPIIVDNHPATLVWRDEFPLRYGLPWTTNGWLIFLMYTAIFTVLVFGTWVVSRLRRLTSILLGILIASAGLMLAGATMAGGLCLWGIALFALGEMLASPRVNTYASVDQDFGVGIELEGVTGTRWAIYQVEHGVAAGRVWADSSGKNTMR